MTDITPRNSVLANSLIPIVPAIVPSLKLKPENFQFSVDGLNKTGEANIKPYEEYQNPALQWGFDKLKEELCSYDNLDAKVIETLIFTFVMATGTGKTKVFLLILMYGIKEGIIHNAMITAPWLMLILQHVKELDDIIGNLKNNGQLPSNFVLEVMNNSSGNKELSSKDSEVYEDLSDEEKIEVIEIETAAKKMLDISEHDGLKHIKFTNMHGSKIKEAVTKNSILKKRNILVFSCMKSAIDFQKHFSKVDTKVFDLLINDEIHNWQSKNDLSKKKKSLTRLVELSRMVLNFTATLKDTVPFPCNDILIGEKVVNIGLAHVRGEYTHIDGVLWPARLKKHIHVILAFVKGKKTLDAQTSNYVEDLGLTPAQYAKYNIIPQCMEYAQNYATIVKALTASIRVSMDRALDPSDEDGKALSGNPVCSEWNTNLQNAVPGIELCQMDGNNKDANKIRTIEEIHEKYVSSLFLQHSIVREGVSFELLNAAIALRNMDAIALAQFLGRILRYDPNCEDAVLFFVIDEDDETSAKRSVDVLVKLALLGISMEDINSLGLMVENTGKDNPKPPILPVKGRMKSPKNLSSDFEEQDLENKAQKILLSDVSTAIRKLAEQQKTECENRFMDHVLQSKGVF